MDSIVANTPRAPSRDWSQKKVKELAKECAYALRSIDERLEEQQVEINQTGWWGWGQWLDAAHKLEGQWGRFGTSAGIQVRALSWKVHERRPWTDSDVATGLPQELLPRTVGALPAITAIRPSSSSSDPWKTHDFSQPLKVAFCVDALEPDSTLEVTGARPALVGRLLELSMHPNAEGWSTRPEGWRTPHDRTLATAFCLYALRRFPNVQDVSQARDAWSELATDIRDPRKPHGQDIVALAGLAILGKRDRGPELDEFLEHSDEVLERWVQGRYARIILDRPWFNSYRDGSDQEANTDYMFLSPEIIISLYWLQRGVKPDLRQYVLEVVQAVRDDILESAPGSHGIRQQETMEGTVDQLWAARLLWKFREEVNSGPPGSLVPPPPPRPPLRERIGERARGPAGLLSVGVVVVAASTLTEVGDAPLLIALAFAVQLLTTQVLSWLLLRGARQRR